MTADIALVALCFAVGVGAGALYFGGLWLTVRDLHTAARPQLRLVLSFLLRMALLLAIFYLLTDRGCVAMLAAMAGLLVSRRLWVAVKGGVRLARG